MRPQSSLLSTHLVLIPLLLVVVVKGFLTTRCPHHQLIGLHRESKVPTLSLSNNKDNDVDIDYIKSELLKYLETRKQVKADDAARSEVGKIIGGTKGNLILEYVSGAPNKPVTIDTPANPLDYDELTKYGFGHLVAPIMKAGGRLEMYKLLGLNPPTITSKPKPATAPKLIIDRTGESDPQRYSGLKLGQILDDNLQAEALERALKNAGKNKQYQPDEQQEGRGRLKSNWTPDWTPERIDEWAKQQGRAQSWARKAREGKFVGDPFENLDLSVQQKVYSIVTTMLVATAFGKATVPFLTQTTGLISDNEQVRNLLEVLQAPAIALVVASLGSCLFCALNAGKLNRNRLIWSIKGLFGGPITVSQFSELAPLITQAEKDEQDSSLNLPKL